MPKIELNVIEIVVVRDQYGPDTIFIDVDLPDPCFPFSDHVMIKMSAGQGTGADYVRNRFGIEPRIV